MHVYRRRLLIYYLYRGKNTSKGSRTMKNYKVLWGIILILVLITGSLSIVLIQNITQLNNVRAESDSFAESLSTLDSEFNTLQQNLDQAKTEISTCENQLSTSENELQATEHELQELTQSSLESIENLERQLELSRDQVDTKSARVRDLVDFENKYNHMICDPDLIDLLKMDYSSIQSSSSRLQGFVANLNDTDHVSFAVRNTLWNNADSKIHGINYVSNDGKTYSRQFLVYVDELGWEEGTFYIDGRCWLDSPW